MRKTYFIIGLFLIGHWAFAQKDSIISPHNLKIYKTLVADTIVFQDKSTFPECFELWFKKDSLTNYITLDSNYYKVDFSRSWLTLKKEFYQNHPHADSLEIRFNPYPDFLTRIYKGYDESLLFPNIDPERAVTIESVEKPLHGKPFEGLETQGNLIRGITVGNNQDAVLNSVLDLTISGKLSSKINLKAHINDTNIPLQENGYSQQLKDIDRVYIEMEGTQWNLKGGDIFLRDSTHYFLNFTKKIQGVSGSYDTEKTHIFTSGALVKGRYAQYEFQGKEANQGPYKLQGTNGELYIFIIVGSERVYINGILQKIERDYVMDYNTGEITFMPTNPINSEMRISIEYQYSDRNYNRFLTHNAVQYNADKWNIGMAFYKESDLKNQPLQLDLTNEQKQILAQTTSESNMYYLVNAIEKQYDSNLILYRKLNSNGTDVFEYSTDMNEILYQVSFTYFGVGKGDYKVQKYLATGKIMQYMGENLGDYKAVVLLTAPSSEQILVLNTQYQSTDKTNVSLELAYSNTNNNLFSAFSESHQKAPALKTTWQQMLYDKKWKATSKVQWDFIQQNFISPEKIYQIEFNRDWNVVNPLGDQSLLQTEVQLENVDRGKVLYQFQNLQFSQNFTGNRHNLRADFKFGKWQVNQWSSFLNTHGAAINSHFLRNETSVLVSNEKWFSQADFILEDNRIRFQGDNSLTPNSFKTALEKWSVGMGDTTKVYVKTGFYLSQNDSVKLNQLKQYHTSFSWFAQSRLLQKEHADLDIFINHRTIQYSNFDTKALNAQVHYRQDLWDKMFTFQTAYQNTSGQVARQDYAYIETHPGQGFYTWIDYNHNNIKEIDEFEIAQFADQAQYLRVLLPNITYVPIQEAGITQTLIWNPSQNHSKNHTFLSHFYNQTQLVAKNTQTRIGSFYHFNPFTLNGSDVLNHQLQWRNQLFFNKGKANYTTLYTFSKNQQKWWQSFGSIYQNLTLHQLDFQHLIEAQWQIGLISEHIENKNTNESYINRNFNLIEENIKPNLTYFFTKNHWLKGAFEFVEKRNTLQGQELLKSQKISIDYHYNTPKETQFSANINWLLNRFTGNSLTAVGYQMLEGLQSGKNAVWNVLWSKKLNAFLYLNLNYQGRTGENSRTIHNGTIQLRANF